MNAKDEIGGNGLGGKVYILLEMRERVGPRYTVALSRGAIREQRNLTPTTKLFTPVTVDWNIMLIGIVPADGVQFQDCAVSFPLGGTR